MTPYLAVIGDSFREAIKSKVLWILLLCWTVILAGIAPFGFIQEKSYRFRGDDIVDQTKLLQQLTAAVDDQGSKSQKAIAKVIGKDDQAFLRQRASKPDMWTPRGRIVDILNQAIADENLYQPEAWPRAERRSELKELLAVPATNLSSLELEQRNRRLIELAFPGLLRPVSENRTWVGYAGLKTPIELPISVKQSRQYIEAIFFPILMRLGLGLVAMLVAVIITSPMIPDMFQSGALHLLLSKPVSRAMLFLSKFVGGCIFVSINIAYMLVGLYFISGLRLGIWNQGILWCIPLFVFVFMTYYSVSALAGLLWKNAIVSVVVTGVFWGICFAVGLVYGIIKPFVEINPTLVNIEVVRDTVFSTNQEGALQVWDERSNVWQTGFGLPTGNLRVYGPYWSESEGRLLFGRTTDNPFGGMMDSLVRLRFATYPELQSKKSDSPESPQSDDGFLSTKNTDFWSESRVDVLPDAPPDTRRIVPWRDSILAINARGIYWLDLEKAIASKNQSNFSLFGLNLPLGAKGEAFRQMTPESWQPKPPFDAAATTTNDHLIFYSQGKLQTLRALDANRLQVEGDSLEVSSDEELLSLIAANDEFVVIASDKSVPKVYRWKTWEQAAVLDSIGEITPRQLKASPDGKAFALLTSEGHLWLIDGVSLRASKFPTPYQGRISAFCLDRQGSVWIGHSVNQVDAYRLDGSATSARIRPSQGTLATIYRWVIQPIYTVNPKPSSLDETITYVLRKDDTLSFLLDTSDLNRAAIKLDPWTPIWSNGLFIVVMLGLGCLLLYRQDL